MVRKFSEMRAKMTPEAQSCAAEKANAMLAEMQLRERLEGRCLQQVDDSDTMLPADFMADRQDAPAQDRDWS